MSDTLLMHIGDLARRAGVSTRTLRFYEQQGLLAPAVRTERGVRIYSAAQVRKLKLIQLLKSLGLRLKQIKEYLSINELDYTGGEIAEQVREMMETQVERLEAKIREYEQAKAELEWAYETFEACLCCQLKASERRCPCEILTEKQDKFPLMVELLT